MSLVSSYKSTPAAIKSATNTCRQATLLTGDALRLAKTLPDNSIDMIFSSPPYCMGKEYESTNNVSDFLAQHQRLLPELVRILKPGGSLCWQTGNHVKDGVVTPLDSLIISLLISDERVQLRNRVVWSVGHGLHCTNRFSGRHETILWYSKGNNYKFNLDAVRVPQKYPGKRHSKGPRKGELSGNPLGKNPGDVWEIPNVKAHHIEKTAHPCQFPVALPQKFIRALTEQDDLILDPFMGSGSTGVAAIIEGRRFLGSDIDPSYVAIAEERVQSALKGKAKVRAWNQALAEPNPNERVARRPEHFFHAKEPQEI
ncbi:DNA-methyltransferase [Alcaligenes endophyticus]|uniref:Methyltransferase n=1 Tax=Alcaligenes endophyticus TaxID=1929088 RepID=A0ABT8EIV4_9BURK|nr:site-specific DNA-methyltransferase [Alcaligenes endophyticus]MCX5592503.1 site-specific DNA-methyltransferase [Alcaligenes endophyticus]MDN4121228.1 site-specific DNA-methyltransferase [Alcaligenes endophyticus]